MKRFCRESGSPRNQKTDAPVVEVTFPVVRISTVRISESRVVAALSMGA